MQYRTFGRTGWQVSEIGYGMWGMGGWTGSDDEESLQSLQRAVELGCNFFDTAWAYGDGHSERLLGQLVRAYPGQASSTWRRRSRRRTANGRRGAESALDDCFPARPHPRSTTEKSLENLGLDCIDLDTVPRLGRCLGGRRALAGAVDDLEARGPDPAVGVSVNRWEP